MADAALWLSQKLLQTFLMRQELITSYDLFKNKWPFVNICLTVKYLSECQAKRMLFPWDSTGLQYWTVVFPQQKWCQFEERSSLASLWLKYTSAVIECADHCQEFLRYSHSLHYYKFTTAARIISSFLDNRCLCLNSIEIIKSYLSHLSMF